jgi:hypothetical protein
MRPSDGCRHDVGGWASTGRAVALVATRIPVALTSHAQRRTATDPTPLPSVGAKHALSADMRFYVSAKVKAKPRPPGHMPARTP